MRFFSGRGMTMRYLVIVAALALGACGQEGGDKPKAKAAAPATLPAGEYEVTSTVTTLASTDNSPLPTFTKQGDRRTGRGCVGSDGLPAPELLAARGDVCQLSNPYVRSGRMNFQLNCQRPGQGQVMADVSGSYTADGFTGTLTATSFFGGSGDFRLVEEITARKVADSCTADPAAAAPAAKG
jgi:hypothetical protein